MRRRDLKPENVMLVSHDSDVDIKITGTVANNRCFCLVLLMHGVINLINLS